MGPGKERDSSSTIDAALSSESQQHGGRELFRALLHAHEGVSKGEVLAADYTGAQRDYLSQLQEKEVAERVRHRVAVNGNHAAGHAAHNEQTSHDAGGPHAAAAAGHQSIFEGEGAPHESGAALLAGLLTGAIRGRRRTTETDGGTLSPGRLSPGRLSTERRNSRASSTCARGSFAARSSLGARDGIEAEGATRSPSRHRSFDRGSVGSRSQRSSAAARGAGPHAYRHAAEAEGPPTCADPVGRHCGSAPFPAVGGMSRVHGDCDGDGDGGDARAVAGGLHGQPGPDLGAVSSNLRPRSLGRQASSSRPPRPADNQDADLPPGSVCVEGSDAAAAAAASAPAGAPDPSPGGGASGGDGRAGEADLDPFGVRALVVAAESCGGGTSERKAAADGGAQSFEAEGLRLQLNQRPQQAQAPPGRTMTPPSDTDVDCSGDAGTDAEVDAGARGRGAAGKAAEPGGLASLAVRPPAAAAAAPAPRRVETQGSMASLAHDGTYVYEEEELSGFSRPRRLVARLCAHPDFEMVVVLVILGNTLTLALYRPTEGDRSAWNRGLFWAEASFNGLFTCEMLLRMLALGGPLAYLRHPWNVFDAAMVVAGYVAFLPTGSSTSSSGVRALRALRALRPLRTVTRFESLRAIVVCFLEAVPLLGSAVGLMLLFMFVFSVAGTNLYANIYHQKCYSDLTGAPEESAEDPDMLGCGHWRTCPANYTCKITRHSDAVNIAGFDHVGLAMLTVFQCITLTGWSFALYRTTDNTNPAATLYYVLLVSIGAYVLVNLFLAVLKIKFAKAQTAFRARNAGRSRTRRNTVMSIFMAAKSRFSEYSAKRSAAHTLNASIASLVQSRLSQYSSMNNAEAGPAADAAAKAVAAAGKAGLAAAATAAGSFRRDPSEPEPAVAAAAAAATASEDGLKHAAASQSAAGSTPGGGRVSSDFDSAHGNGSPRGANRGSPAGGHSAAAAAAAAAATRHAGGSPARGRAGSGGGGHGLDKPEAAPDGLWPVHADARALAGEFKLASGDSNGRLAGASRDSAGGASPWSPGAGAVPCADAAAAGQVDVAGGENFAPGHAQPHSSWPEGGEHSHGGFMLPPLPLPPQRQHLREVQQWEGHEGAQQEQEQGQGQQQPLPLPLRRGTRGQQLPSVPSPTVEASEATVNGPVGPAAAGAVAAASAELAAAASSEAPWRASAGVRAVSVQAGGSGTPSGEASSAAGAAAATAALAALASAPAGGGAGAGGGPVAESVELPPDSSHCPRASSAAVPPQQLRQSGGECQGQPLPGLLAGPSGSRRELCTSHQHAHCDPHAAGPTPAAHSAPLAPQLPQPCLPAPLGPQPPQQRQEQQQTTATTAAPPPALVRAGSSMAFRSALQAAAVVAQGGASRGGGHSMSGPPGMPADPQAMLGHNLAIAALMMDPAEFDDYVAGEPPLRRLYLRSMFRARVLANSDTFAYCMLAVIVANTITLAMQFDGMSQSYATVLRDCNYVFTALFTIEMAVKLFGMGFWDYILDGFNLFDGLVVIISWVEIIMTCVASGSKLNAIAALRAFRALRLLKAFRYLGPLRKIAAMLLASFASFAAIAVLIALFWLVFSIVGMHVFGGLPLDRDPYPNFDTFLNSLVTTFNILTLENYQVNMYETVRASNYGAAAFFVAWIVVGKYILLTLFLAVTLEAFEAKYDTQGASSSWMSKMRSAMGSAVGSVVGSVRRSVDGRRGSSTGGGGGAGGGSFAAASEGRRTPSAHGDLLALPDLPAAATATDSSCDRRGSSTGDGSGSSDGPPRRGGSRAPGDSGCSAAAAAASSLYCTAPCDVAEGAEDAAAVVVEQAAVPTRCLSGGVWDRRSGSSGGAGAAGGSGGHARVLSSGQAVYDSASSAHVGNAPRQAGGSGGGAKGYVGVEDLSFGHNPAAAVVSSARRPASGSGPGPVGEATERRRSHGAGLARERSSGAVGGAASPYTASGKASPRGSALAAATAQAAAQAAHHTALPALRLARSKGAADLGGGDAGGAAPAAAAAATPEPGAPPRRTHSRQGLQAYQDYAAAVKRSPRGVARRASASALAAEASGGADSGPRAVGPTPSAAGAAAAADAGAAAAAVQASPAVDSSAGGRSGSDGARLHPSAALAAPGPAITAPSDFQATGEDATSRQAEAGRCMGERPSGGVAWAAAPSPAATPRLADPRAPRVPDPAAAGAAPAPTDTASDDGDGPLLSPFLLDLLPQVQTAPLGEAPAAAAAAAGGPAAAASVPAAAAERGAAQHELRRTPAGGPSPSLSLRMRLPTSELDAAEGYVHSGPVSAVVSISGGGAGGAQAPATASLRRRMLTSEQDEADDMVSSPGSTATAASRTGASGARCIGGVGTGSLRTRTPTRDLDEVEGLMGGPPVEPSPVAQLELARSFRSIPPALASLSSSLAGSLRRASRGGSDCVGAGTGAWPAARGSTTGGSGGSTSGGGSRSDSVGGVGGNGSFRGLPNGVWSGRRSTAAGSLASTGDGSGGDINNGRLLLLPAGVARLGSGRGSRDGGGGGMLARVVGATSPPPRSPSPLNPYARVQRPSAPQGAIEHEKDDENEGDEGQGGQAAAAAVAAPAGSGPSDRQPPRLSGERIGGITGAVDTPPSTGLQLRPPSRDQLCDPGPAGVVRSSPSLPRWASPEASPPWEAAAAVATAENSAGPVSPLHGETTCGSGAKRAGRGGGNAILDDEDRDDPLLTAFAGADADAHLLISSALPVDEAPAEPQKASYVAVKDGNAPAPEADAHSGGDGTVLAHVAYRAHGGPLAHASFKDPSGGAPLAELLVSSGVGPVDDASPAAGFTAVSGKGRQEEEEEEEWEGKRSSLTREGTELLAKLVTGASAPPEAATDVPADASTAAGGTSGAPPAAAAPAASPSGTPGCVSPSLLQLSRLSDSGAELPSADAGEGSATAAAAAAAVPTLSSPPGILSPGASGRGERTPSQRKAPRGRVCIELPEGVEQDGCAPGERPAFGAGGVGGGANGAPVTAEAAAQALLYPAATQDSLDMSVSRLDSRATSLALSTVDDEDGRRRSGRPGGDGDGGCGDGGKKHKGHRHHNSRIPLEGKSFFFVDTSNRWRRRTYRAVYSRAFEYALFGIIIVNCGMMTLEGPGVRPGSPMDMFLHWGNAVCTIVFALEMVIKVFAWTFVLYIKDITNQVDFLVVVTGLLELVLAASQVKAVAALRVLRALKPLRLLTRSAGMRLVFKSVVLSLGAMAHVSVLCVMFLLIFAILGVQLFSGKLHSCNDASVSGRAECVGSFTDPASGATLQRSWGNMWPNFDNVGNALLACFVVASCNGYAELMAATMASRSDPDSQPRMNANPAAFFWFVGFTVVVSFTLLNLYVGVIFSQFSRIRNMSTTGSAFLTSNQQEWVELSKMVFRLRPPERSSLPRGRWRLRVWRLVQGPGFERFMMGVILLNVALLAATWYGEPQAAEDWQAHLNIAFTGVYALEAALKIFGLGRRRYFKDAWNRFDFLLLLISLLDVALSFLHAAFLRILRVFRLQRLLRITRLVRKSKGIKTLFQSLVMSLPAFGNVGALIGLFFFMYAYVGVLLFGRVGRGDDDAPINASANFSNFPFALSALFRVATGDNWTDVMYGCMVQPPDCDRAAGGCGSWAALPYFLSFFLLIAVIMLNLFTAVIIENFEKTHEQDAWRLTPQNLEDFVMLWSEYDDGSGSIDPSSLEELLLRLDPPLGLGPHADNKEVLKFVYDLDIPLVNGRVPFHKTAFELVKRISQAEIPEGQLKAQLEALIEAFFRDLAVSQPDEQMQFSVAVSVMLIQRRWRTLMRAARMRKKRAWREGRRDAPPYSALLAGAGVQVDGSGGVEGAASAAAAAGVWRASAVASEGGANAVVGAYREAVAAAAAAAAEAAAAAAAKAKAAAAAAKAKPGGQAAASAAPDGGASLPARPAFIAAAAPRTSIPWRFNPDLAPRELTAALAARAGPPAGDAAAERPRRGLYHRFRRMLSFGGGGRGEGAEGASDSDDGGGDDDDDGGGGGGGRPALVRTPSSNLVPNGGGGWAFVRRLLMPNRTSKDVPDYGVERGAGGAGGGGTTAAGGGAGGVGGGGGQSAGPTPGTTRPGTAVAGGGDASVRGAGGGGGGGLKNIIQQGTAWLRASLDAEEDDPDRAGGDSASTSQQPSARAHGDAATRKYRAMLNFAMAANELTEAARADADARMIAEAAALRRRTGASAALRGEGSEEGLGGGGGGGAGGGGDGRRRSSADDFGGGGGGRRRSSAETRRRTSADDRDSGSGGGGVFRGRRSSNGVAGGGGARPLSVIGEE